MTSPISVGDVLQLARLAYRLGQAFTSGRKSAPAEFVEVQNLLHSLSQSLELLSRDALHDGSGHVARVDTDTEAGILMSMIISCRETLVHLETLVAKYSDIQPGGSEGSRSWKEDIRRNWKKILWTKEGGDIGRLKVTLSTHVNGLNLAVSSMNKSQVDTVHSKLDEIYRWFKDNLDGKRKATSSQDQSDLPQQPINHMFSILEISPGTDRKRSVCPRATVDLGSSWQDDFDTPDSNAMFRCCCFSNSSHPTEDSMNHQQGMHQHQLGYTLHPASLLLRIPNKSSKQIWQMHVSTALRADPTTILMENLHPSATQLFERFIDQITYLQAKRHFAANLSTMMVSHSPHEVHDGMVAILNMMSPSLAQHANDIGCASFTSNGRKFVTSRVRDAHLLHYRLTAKRHLPTEDSIEHPKIRLVPEPYARYVLECNDSTFSDGEQSNSLQYTVHIDRNTRMELGDNSRMVAISESLCASNSESHDAATTQWAQCSSINIEYLSATAARASLEALQAMKRELFLIYLRYPCHGEQVVFRRLIDHCMVHNTRFTNATITVVLNSSGDKYRLIILDQSLVRFVCVELPNDFLQRISTGDDVMSDSFAAWYVEMSAEGAMTTKIHIELGPLIGEDHAWNDMSGIE